MPVPKAGDVTYDGNQIFLVLSNDNIVRVKGAQYWVDRDNNFKQGNTSFKSSALTGDTVLFNLFDMLRKAGL
jgi:hypothetical protein